MSWLRRSVGFALPLVLVGSCDPVPPPEYLAVGGRSSRELDRGTYESTAPAILALETQDTTATVCPGIALACPGQERTSLRTLVTYTGVSEGRAAIHGSTADRQSTIEFKVEQIRRFEVRLVPPGDNGEGQLLPLERPVPVAVNTSVTLHFNALGASSVPLGYVDQIDVQTAAPDIATVTFNRYSHGWHAKVSGVVPGETSLTVVTPWASQQVQIRVE
jgi:hypothetical protein